ncbi:methionine--tRNA ligase [Candidatus Woesearchaeota archaeon]|nr:methionine--tRNA ligase [Candidatus Woesearchaeota archaeon]
MAVKKTKRSIGKGKSKEVNKQINKKNNKRTLVTSALPYVNNVPHLGTLVCVISADVYTRFLKLDGQEAIYVLGTDEHGTTAEVKALAEGVTPRQLVDKYFKLQKEIYDWFLCSPDAFGRTSDKENFEVTIDIFNKLNKNGFVFEDIVKQTYCPKCDKFLSDRFVTGECPHCGYENAKGDQCEHCGKLLDALDLIDAKCEVCGTSPEERESKHLFMDLPKIESKLGSWIKKQSVKGKWTVNAKTMTEAWLKEGLKPRCITRDLKWGVPVPLEGFEGKVFYSWFDAPIGYISITKKNKKDWRKWWHAPKDVKLVQFMGKDNIPFHTILFPSFLIGAKDDYTLLDHISSNEYLNYEGGQFSKSRHSGVFGDDAKNTGIKADVWRYYIMVNRPEKSDTEFSWADFQSKINHELVANVGNLVNRVLKFLNSFYGGKVPAGKLGKREKKFFADVAKKESEVLGLLGAVKIKDALREIMNTSKLGNQYFQESAPWKNFKLDKEKADTSLFVLVNFVKDLALLLKPYLPETAEGIEKQLKVRVKSFDELGELSVKEGHKVGKAEALFERINDDRLNELREQFSGDKKIDSLDEFSKLELRVSKILKVEDHPDADKLYVIQIDTGGKIGGGKRQICAGIKNDYSVDELVGRKIIVVTNLKPAKLRGVESNGMLLAAETDKVCRLLEVGDSEVGERVFVGESCDECGDKDSFSQITIDDFAKVKMVVKKGKIIYCGNELKTNKGPVFVKDMKDGARVH